MRGRIRAGGRRRARRALARARVGRGSAAAGTALLMQEPDRSFAELAKRYDIATARTIWRLSRRAVRELIQTLGTMNCGLEVAPLVPHRQQCFACARSQARLSRPSQRGARRPAARRGGVAPPNGIQGTTPRPAFAHDSARASAGKPANPRTREPANPRTPEPPNPRTREPATTYRAPAARAA